MRNDSTTEKAEDVPTSIYQQMYNALLTFKGNVVGVQLTEKAFISPMFLLRT